MAIVGLQIRNCLGAVIVRAVSCNGGGEVGGDGVRKDHARSREWC